MLILRNLNLLLIIWLVLSSSTVVYSQTITYPIVDTDFDLFTSHSDLITAPGPGEPFYGQDATYEGNKPNYTDHNDGTITDHVTGLTWEKDMGTKISWAEAKIKADTMTKGGYDDWRVPGIKELYSLILFSGRVSGATAIEPFIQTDYFNQPLGDPDLGEREIDAQTWSSTEYVGLTMKGDSTVFGVNFVDGRIKGYPKYKPGSDHSIPNIMFFRMVRGNTSYGANLFSDNGNGTITDHATGLMWQQEDDGQMRDWQSALSYAENLVLGGYDDWRLPNAKELQSIVDYGRSPSTTGTPAIDPLFSTSTIEDPDGNPQHFPYFWTGTTHQDGPNPYSSAVYVVFGEALGEMNGILMDVHGAGAQRSDPKSGDAADYPVSFGPQGDIRYVFNAVRCVRVIDYSGLSSASTSADKFRLFPNPAMGIVYFRIEGDRDHQIHILDMTGKMVAHINLRETGSIDISHLQPGIYLVKTDGGLTYKFMKS